MPRGRSGKVSRLWPASAAGTFVVAALLACPLLTGAVAAAPEQAGAVAAVADDTALPGLGATIGPTGPADLPNIVIVYTDDQRIDSTAGMMRLRQDIGRLGVTFSNAHAPTPLCCPSRVSLLSGQPSQVTGVWSNQAPRGGFAKFYATGGEARTLATQLDAVGYRTALIGKYLNGYGESATRIATTGDDTYIPPGWDAWHAFAYPVAYSRDGDATDYRDFWLMHRAESEPVNFRYHGFRSSDYSTTVLSRIAVNTIETTPETTPLFMLVTPWAPHAPYRTTSRYMTAPVPGPRYLPVGFGRTTGKPPWVTELPRVSAEKSRMLRARQIRALYPVDDAVGAIVDALTRAGRMDNTLFVYASDNGYTWGEFNILGQKRYPYTTPVPLMMRWDGHLSAGSMDSRIVSNVDITATALAAAGVAASTPPGGIDLVTPASRESLLIASAGKTREGALRAYCGIRTSDWLYVRYAGGFEELYNVAVDPYFLTNLASRTVHEGTMAELRSKTMEQCSPTPPGFTW